MNETPNPSPTPPAPDFKDRRTALIVFGVLEIVLGEMYRVMGYSERQIDAMKQFNFLQGNRMVYWSMAGLVPMLAFLLFVKRYFRPQAESEGS